jgi:hypothetical protein
MPDRIIVTVDSNALDQIDRVAQDLRNAGVTVDQVLSATGIITGSVDAGRKAAVRRVRGVASVEADADFHIPPPDSDIQ